jgi:hypothetical protein
MRLRRAFLLSTIIAAAAVALLLVSVIDNALTFAHDASVS